MMNEINEINEMDLMELTDEMLEEIAGGKKIVATGNVKVRKGPGTDFAVIGYMNKGQYLIYDGASEKDANGRRWYRVKFHGGFGWVSSKYSKKQ